MKRNSIPSEVQSRLDKLERQVTHWIAQLKKNQEAIVNARERLTGGFQRDEEYRDTRAALDKLVNKDLPTAERKLDDAQFTLAECKSFLADLPDDVTLEPVAPVKPNGADLAGVREQIKNAEDKLETLSRVPLPSADIEQRVKECVTSLGRPAVAGIDGGKLEVTWPSDNAASLLAILMPERVVEAILSEIDRAANAPMPLDQRRKRIVELRRMIDDLQRVAFALGANDYSLPPEVVLGVRVVRREVAKKVERRVAAEMK